MKSVTSATLGALALLSAFVAHGNKHGQFIVPRPTPITAVNCTPNVADLQPATVQAAILNASAGSTVCLPAGTATWTSYVLGYPTIAANITVMGQTTCAGAAATLVCTDNTVITDHIDRSSTDRGALTLYVPTTGTTRVSGLTFKQDNGLNCGSVNYCSTNGAILLTVDGGSTFGTVRVDHVHLDHMHYQGMVVADVQGVADHIYGVMDDPSAYQPVRSFGFDTGVAWTEATNFGSPTKWFYFEDSYFANGLVNDCFSSAKQVFRYNYTTNSGVQQHGLGHSSSSRGCRSMEAYGNALNGGATAVTTAIGIYNGSAVIFDNSTNGTTNSFVQYTETRQSNNTYPQTAIPTGIGYCGTQFNGTASVWDGNTNAATGYPCWDQVGRGPGDLVNSSLPVLTNSTRACTVNFAWSARASNCDHSDSSAWPRQSLEPVYEFNNTGSVLVNWTTIFTVGALVSPIARDRDFYSSHDNGTNCDTSASPCTAGVGTGTFAQMSAKNCTTGASGGGVGWWATDRGGDWKLGNGNANDGALYKCTATNTWTLYYTPYTYPYPY